MFEEKNLVTIRELIEDAFGEILNYNTDEVWLKERIDKFLEKFYEEFYDHSFARRQGFTVR
jgi:hypothetical protein